MEEVYPETPEALKNRDMPEITEEGLQALGRVVERAQEETAETGSDQDSQDEVTTESAVQEPSEPTQPPDSPAV